MAADYFVSQALGGGVNLGRTLIQAKGAIGGTRAVFVKLQGAGKNGLVFPTTGGLLANPFPGRAKIWAGDLFEYNPGLDGSGATVKLLKTYKVAVAASEATEVQIVRNGFSHIPFVGDILMVAPDEIDGTGTASTVTAVTAETATVDDATIQVWTLTLDTAITAEAGDILVEADSEGNPIVTNPNAVAPCDYDFFYTPASDDDEYGARYLITPALANEDTKMYIAKMSPLPDSVLALNKSRVEGWFNL